MLTSLKREPQAEWGAGNEAKQPPKVGSGKWEGKEGAVEAAGVGHAYLILKVSLSWLPGVPSQPSWEGNTWYPGPGEMSVSEGLDIPVHSFIVRGNSGKGEREGRNSRGVLGKFLCFPAGKRHSTTHCFEGMTVIVCVCPQSIHIYIYISVYVCLCNIQSYIGIFYGNATSSSVKRMLSEKLPILL